MLKPYSMQNIQVLFKQILMVFGMLFYGIDAVCINPPLASNYTNQLYSGFWYEIGRVRLRIPHKEIPRNIS